MCMYVCVFTFHSATPIRAVCVPLWQCCCIFTICFCHRINIWWLTQTRASTTVICSYVYVYGVFVVMRPAAVATARECWWNDNAAWSVRNESCNLKWEKGVIQHFQYIYRSLWNSTSTAIAPAAAAAACCRCPFVNSPLSHSPLNVIFGWLRSAFCVFIRFYHFNGFPLSVYLFIIIAFFLLLDGEWYKAFGNSYLEKWICTCVRACECAFQLLKFYS